MKIDKHAIDRHFFEDDDEFDDKLSNLLKGYDKAAKMAASSAKRATLLGTLSSIREAQWKECIVSTIEECLFALRNPTTDFELPQQPEFDAAGVELAS